MKAQLDEPRRVAPLAAALAVALAVTDAYGVDPKAAPVQDPAASKVAAETPATAPASPSPTFKEEELAAILAPIALYPDTVVAQILMASTYPLEIVEASRWLEKNKTLQGEALAKAAKQQSWAESVQAMTALPDVLKMMDEKLDWTQKLGDAYLAQPADVMAMVQQLRAKAKDEGNLKSDDHMKVSVADAPAEPAGQTVVVEQPAQTIVIESADPEVIYVPSYNPTVIYGSWGYPAYPPYYYYPPGYGASWGAGFFWGAAIGISVGWWGGGWNCYPDWHGGDINIGEINIDRGDRTNISGGDRVNTGDRAGSREGSSKFQHDPSHRQGVSYRDPSTAQKFDRASGGQVSTREASRGQASAATRPTGTGGAGVSTRDAGARPSGGTGAGPSTRDLGSTPSRSGSASTRDVSTGTRTLGTTPSRSSSSPSASPSSRGTSSSASRGSSSSSSAFSGSSSGRSASSYGSRGGMSRGGGGGGRRR